MLKASFLLFVSIGVLLIVIGCYKSTSEDGSDKDEDENKDDILEILDSPKEASKSIAELVCDYYEQCPQSLVSCSVRDIGGQVSDADCSVGSTRGFDRCVQSITQTMEAAFRCVEFTDELASKTSRCLQALRSKECVDVTDEDLRAFEMSLAQGGNIGPSGMPDACIGIEESFACAVDRDSSSEFDPVLNNCVPGEVRECACVDGTIGEQICMSDGSRLSPCVCSGTVAQFAQAGSGGAAGAVPIPMCNANQVIPCICSDGSMGTSICVDGERYSPCQCAIAAAGSGGR